ncbi:hypothetical protein FRB94_006853 [Tulasnella sp. JGI-2019a]|nr:hypothetical protein FRB94_006853 [Tulasnella sp. JGI-2019a]KAG9017770.1 hypothetical protein FRB93_004581 [Tulasnella sp. JGI-2019a]KAG9035839.1 hypothetical protein FRB95_010433 [Tulasnella sp. JGI-2019a]
MSYNQLSLDASSLILIQTSLAFIVTPFTAPVYNFPLFLYGLYAVEKTDSNEPLRLFSGMVGLSVLFDFIWLFRQDWNSLIGLLIIINMMVKGPTFFAVLTALRFRGDRFGALGDRGEGDSLPSTAGNTVWSMPGGFSGGKPGYQNIDDDLEEGAPAPSSAPARQPLSTPAVPGPAAHSHQAQVPTQ